MHRNNFWLSDILTKRSIEQLAARPAWSTIARAASYRPSGARAGPPSVRQSSTSITASATENYSPSDGGQRERREAASATPPTECLRDSLALCHYNAIGLGTNQLRNGNSSKRLFDCSRQLQRVHRKPSRKLTTINTHTTCWNGKSEGGEVVSGVFLLLRWDDDLPNDVDQIIHKQRFSDDCLRIFFLSFVNFFFLIFSFFASFCSGSESQSAGRRPDFNCPAAAANSGFLTAETPPARCIASGLYRIALHPAGGWLTE